MLRATRRLQVRHTTRYTYDRPVTRSAHRLHLRPIDDWKQTVLSYRLQVLAHSPLVYQGRRSYSDMTYYTVPSGAAVFSAGTLLFEFWLGFVSEDPDDRSPEAQVRRMMANVLTEFARGPAGRRYPAEPNLDRLGIT